MKKLSRPLTAPPTETALLSAAPELIAPQRMISCVVCGSSTLFGSPEEMCWVCRRLKISAWRDVEPQMPAQE